jgi:parallel beta-helix repeat protein
MDFRHIAMYACLLISFGNAPASARTLLVDDDVAQCPEAEYNTIQQAVAAAQAGDKIFVCPGLYTGTVLVTESNLQIEAHGGPGEVVLQGTGAAGELGFRLLNTTGVVLQGFTVQGFGRAQIRVEGGSENTVRKNVTSAAVLNDGIQVTGSSSNVASANLIEHNTSYANREDGIYVGVITDILPFHPAFDNLIRHNETFDNRHGVNLNRTGSGNVIFGNRSHDNSQRGISNGNLSHGNEIKFNHVFANGLNGILVVDSSEVTVTNNRAEGNGSNGIAVTATVNNVAAENVVTQNLSGENAASGVLLNGATRSVVEKNLLVRNLDGVRMFNNAAANGIQSNVVWRSGRDGIRAEGATRENAIEQNVIGESAEHDAHDDSLGTGTGGTANFWVNNHCETESQLGLCDH